MIFIGLITALVVARQMFVPESFGKYGHYRADAVDEIAALDISYAGSVACGDCHDDVFETKMASNHAGVACEVCHGPAARHIEDPDEFTPPVPHGRDQCLICHGYNPARPSGFPQILPNAHNPAKSCMSCHNPHEPVLPHSPEACSACHREIANVKLVSHHTDLPCTQCHDVADEHKSDPRRVRANKPTSKDICNVCHAKGAEGERSIPRIDAEDHGGRYICWDCHYPHFPEANR